MKKVTLKKLSVENYKKFEAREFDFAGRTEVSGRNRQGKTSLMDAYFDVLTGKLADGTLPNNIRRKVDGEEIDDPVVRELVIDVDGTEYVVQKKTKKGKSSNTVEYYVNGIKRNKTEYMEILKRIADPDTIAMCSNARVFLNEIQKATAKARETLGGIAGFSESQFRAEHPEYEWIKNEGVEGDSIEEILKARRRDLRKRRIKMANKTQVATAGEQQAAVVINNQFIDGLTKQLEEKCKYGLSFPKDYNLSNALMGAYLVLKETKDRNNKPILESCSQISIANSLMNMATLGLSVQKKQGYFIAYSGQCQFQRSYFGNMTIARRYGMKDIHAEIIYQGDKFKYHIEDGNKVLDSHEQDFLNIDNEKILGAYAVVLMEDGTKYLEVMNIKQIKQAWSQGFGYKENGNGTHQKFTDQMAKKTVVNRALKQIINTHGDVFVQEADNDTETVSKDDAFAADVAYDIEQNANTEEFIPESMAIEEQPKQPTVAETVQMVEKEPEIPDFMKQEEM